MIHVHDSNIVGDESWFHRILSKNRETKRAHSASITWEIFCFTKSLFSLKFWWRRAIQKFHNFHTTSQCVKFTHFFSSNQFRAVKSCISKWCTVDRCCIVFQVTCSLAKMKINYLSWKIFREINFKSLHIYSLARK